MEDTLHFGELSSDEDLKSRILGFDNSLKEVQAILDTFCSIDTYNELTLQDKVRYELFHSFAISSLYWFYLRIKGVDPNQHELRSELNRIRDFMARSKKIYEKQTMPRLDQEAAKRFIKSGLWTPKENERDDSIERTNRPSKKRKRESDGEGNET